MEGMAPRPSQALRQSQGETPGLLLPEAEFFASCYTPPPDKSPLGVSRWPEPALDPGCVHKSQLVLRSEYADSSCLSAGGRGWGTNPSLLQEKEVKKCGSPIYLERVALLLGNVKHP